MKFSELALLPFRYFSPPIVSLPFSTIKVPPTPISMGIIFASFIFICGGFVFCQVRGMPTSGYVRGNDGKVYHAWIEYGNVGNQFLMEGIVAASLFSLAAASIISAFFVLSRPNNGNNSELYRFLEMFALSSPVWCLFSYLIFHLKLPSYKPKFHPR